MPIGIEWSRPRFAGLKSFGQVRPRRQARKGDDKLPSLGYKKAASQAAFFLYGPRFLATGSGTSAAISSSDQT